MELRDELAVEPTGEVAYRCVPWGHPGRAGIDGDACDLGRVDPSSDAVPSFDHDDVVSCSGELIRGGEAREARADDDDVGGSYGGTVHGISVRAVWVMTAVARRRPGSEASAETSDEPGSASGAGGLGHAVADA
nr:hypothetical protein [Couchioplanes caeruleus]